MLLKEQSESSGIILMSNNQVNSASLRNKSRVDYKVLNNTGQFVLKPSLLSNTTENQPETIEIMSNTSEMLNENLHHRVLQLAKVPM